MKKFYAFISVLLVLSAAVFADVSVKKLDNGQIEVTFFYPNPRATEVVIAGDFTDWQNGALAMTKSDKGWTYVRNVPAGTVMKYKFISDGNWTEDMHEPDKVDDGFGGHNGLVDVDAMIAASAGTASAADTGAAAKKANLKFSTWSMLGYQTKWNLRDDANNDQEKGLDSAGLNLKSYIKFSGTALPNVPVYVEVAVAEQDGFDNLYKKGTTEWADGWKNLGVDTVFDPMYYYGGQAAAKTYLGHLKLGFESPYVNYTTGYKYAKLPPHNINGWVTVDKEWEAGYESVGGYNYFELGQNLQQIGPMTLKAAVSPNRSADRKGNQYGLFSWVDASFGPMADINIQYNGAYGKTFDTIFGHSYEHDIIVGYKGIFGPLTATVNGLYNFYGDGDLTKINGVVYYSKYIPSTSDVGEVDPSLSGLSNMAVNAQLKYSDDMFTAVAGFRFRGKQASMMYVEEGADDHTDISDQLGGFNIMRPWMDVSYTGLEGLVVGVQPYVEMTLQKNDYTTGKYTFNDKDTMLVFAKPYASFDLGEVLDIKAVVDGYARLEYVTKDADRFTRGTDTTNFLFESAGLKYDQKFDLDAVKEITVTYGFDNTNAKYMFHTLIGTATLAQEIGVQAGVGVRVADNGVDASNSPFGGFVGVFKKLPVLARPTAYLQGLYAMDPYNKFGDGPTAFKFNSDLKGAYTLKNGVDNYANNAAVRVGLQWDL